MGGRRRKTAREVECPEAITFGEKGDERVSVTVLEGGIDFDIAQFQETQAWPMFAGKEQAGVDRVDEVGTLG